MGALPFPCRLRFGNSLLHAICVPTLLWPYADEKRIVTAGSKSHRWEPNGRRIIAFGTVRQLCPWIPECNSKHVYTAVLRDRILRLVCMMLLRIVLARQSQSTVRYSLDGHSDRPIVGGYIDAYPKLHCRRRAGFGGFNNISLVASESQMCHINNPRRNSKVM